MNSGIPKGGAIERLVIGLFIFFWGLLWLLQQAGFVQKSVEIWPFALITFGALITAGGIYRLRN